MHGGISRGWQFCSPGRVCEACAAGDALLISPIVHKGANATETYFPAGTWYNMYNYSTVDASSGPKNVTVQVRPHCTAACGIQPVCS